MLLDLEAAWWDGGVFSALPGRLFWISVFLFLRVCEKVGQPSPWVAARQQKCLLIAD